MNKINDHQQISEEFEMFNTQVDSWLDKVSTDLAACKDRSIRYKAELDDFSREINEHSDLLEKQLASLSFFSKKIIPSDYIEPSVKLTE